MKKNVIYTLDKFKEDYEWRYESYLLPKLMEFEYKRWLTIFKFILVCLFIIVPGIWFRQHIWIAILVLINAAHYNSAYKIIAEDIPHELHNLLPDFIYDELSAINIDETHNAKLFPSFVNKRGLACTNFLDSYWGNISGVHLSITNYDYSLLYKNSSLSLFKGFIIKYVIDTEIDGQIVIRPNTKGSDIADLISKGYTQYLEVSSAFRKKYFIFTNNPSEAKRILSVQFLVFFDNFSKAMGDNIYCSICNNNIYVATTKGKQFVDFSDITKSVLKRKHYDYFYNVFTNIINLTNGIRSEKKLCSINV